MQDNSSPKTTDGDGGNSAPVAEVEFKFPTYVTCGDGVPYQDRIVDVHVRRYGDNFEINADLRTRFNGEAAILAGFVFKRGTIRHIIEQLAALDPTLIPRPKAIEILTRNVPKSRGVERDTSSKLPPWEIEGGS